MVEEAKKVKILLVDDKEENLISLEAMLEESHRVFLKATNGNDALKIALKTPDLALIILDVQMPEMDGYEVANLLQANSKTRHISIIFVTAINKEEQYVLRGYQEGAIAYLSKPLDIAITQQQVKVFEKLYFYQRDLKQLLQEKNDINQQLERFMYVVAHDLKSPLTSVMSLMSYLQEMPEVSSSELLKPNFDLCQDTLRYMQHMIGSILDYSATGVKDSQKSFVDVGNLLQHILQVLKLGENVVVRIAEPMPVLNTPYIKLQQVFQNIISNAIKHNDKPICEIDIYFEHADDYYYRFCVKDNGKGVSKEDRIRIFNLFEKTVIAEGKRENNTGVGLNIVKLLVEEQGGKLTLESNPQGGSIFSFTWQK